MFIKSLLPTPIWHFAAAKVRFFCHTNKLFAFFYYFRRYDVSYLKKYYLCTMKNFKIIGLIITAIGAIILLTCLFTELKNNNTVMISALLLVIVGIIAYVALWKKEDKY